MPTPIERLATQDRSQFSCGNPDLDDWFHLRARQDQRRDMAQVYVALDPGQGVIGFYCLSSFTVVAVELPSEVTRRLPRYELIPAILIGRFATYAPVARDSAEC